MEGTIGEIRLFAANFAPKYWWYCDGSLLSISTNAALYSILGTTYGGNGVNTFGLPDLRGRSAIGTGQGAGLSHYVLGESTGVSAVTLTTANLPSHTHTATGSVVIPAFSDEGDSGSPADNVLAAKSNMYTSDTADSGMKPFPVNIMVGVAGASNPLNITQPLIGMNYIICLTGIYPSRS